MNMLSTTVIASSTSAPSVLTVIGKSSPTVSVLNVITNVPSSSVTASNVSSPSVSTTSVSAGAGTPSIVTIPLMFSSLFA